MRANMALYLSARGFGQTGHNLFLATILIIAGTGSHAAVGLGSIVAATTISAMILGIPCGAVADRLGPGRGFALGGALRAAMIGVALFVPSSAAVIVAVAFVYAAFSQIHNPSELALVKVISGNAAGRTHSLLIALQYGGQALGFLVLAPACYFLGGTDFALAVALAIVGGQVALATWLALRTGAAVPNEPSLRPGHFSGIRETLSLFAHSEPARDALAVQAIRMLVAQVVLVAFPLYVKHDLSIGNEGAAFLLVPGILGAGAGLLWTAASRPGDGTLRAMRLSALGLAISVFALAALDYGVTAVFSYSQLPPLVRFEAALNTTVVVAMPVAFLLGATLSVATVSARAALTSAAPLPIQSRVFAVQNTVADALVILPLLFAGVAAEFLGARTTLGALGMICAVTWLLMWHPRFQLPYLARRSTLRA